MQFLFKENVRYLVWTCRDPIFPDSRDPMIIFTDSRDPNQVPKTPLKKPDLVLKISYNAMTMLLLKSLECIQSHFL